MLDELNKLSKKRTNKKAIPYDEYFGYMELDRDEVEDRISFANALDDAIFYFLQLLLTMMAIDDVIDTDYFYSAFIDKITGIVSEYNESIADDSYTVNHIRELAWDTIDTTIAHKDDPYYTSYDRAMVIAENEANTFANYKVEKDAINSGRTRKTWITMRDKSVRHTHEELDGMTVPINELFQVGDSLMAYPKDCTYDPNPTEVVNCRCVCQYS